MINENTPKCEHVLHENGIHEFTLRDSSTAGADAYLAELEKLYQSRNNTSQPLRVLLDSAGATLPISYTMQRGKELIARYPSVGTICTATLTERMIEARLADSFMRLMRFPNTRVRFFEQSRRDDAVEWLLHEK